jgi:hypothetical protein
MTQGSRINNQVINLDDDLIVKRLAKPAKVFLAGREWAIRRDLTAEEIYAFWGHATVSKVGPCLSLLMGITEEEGEKLDELLQQLPGAMYLRKIKQIIEIAGLRRGDESEDTTGESTPS